jgi:dipeptidase D
VIDGKWVRAKGTTLGADDGIGMAIELAILADKTIEHGPLECLFTVDEETGLTGAFALRTGFISGDYLINLDSEDEGQIFIGCAGGGDTVAVFEYKTEPTPADSLAYNIQIKGLIGGHSGDEIDKGRGNAIKLLNRFLFDISNNLQARISDISGGNMHNAIPREASAIVVIPGKHERKLKLQFHHFYQEIKNELSMQEPKIEVIIEREKVSKVVIDAETQAKLIASLYACPHGVIAMSAKMPGLVETSTNLASIRLNGKTRMIKIATSQRSSIETSKIDIMNMVESVFTLAGAKVKHGDGYPGWDPNPDSTILKIAVDSYTKLFGKQPIVRAIHAGLECGLFLKKYPQMEMISFGPTLRLVHTPDEKIEIETVEKCWQHTLEILKNIPKKK